MEKFTGILSIRLQNQGSKSEGRYALLLCEEQPAPIRLCREGQPSHDDLYFEPFDGREVIVTGHMSHDWLIVEAIEAVPNDQTQENIEEQ